MTTLTDYQPPPGMHLCDPWDSAGYLLPIGTPCPHDQTPPTAPPTVAPPPTTTCWNAIPARADCGPNPNAPPTTTPGQPVTTVTPTTTTTEAPTTSATTATAVRTSPPRTTHHTAVPTTHPAALPETGAAGTGLLVLAAVLCAVLGTLLITITRRRGRHEQQRA